MNSKNNVYCRISVDGILESFGFLLLLLSGQNCYVDSCLYYSKVIYYILCSMAFYDSHFRFISLFEMCMSCH